MNSFSLRSLVNLCWLVVVLFFAASGFAATGQPAGVPLLRPELSALTYFGAGERASLIKEVPVEGKYFSRALQVDTFARTEPRRDFGLEAHFVAPIKKGDVLWISFQARSLESRRETGESSIELRVDQLANGKYVWPPYLERGISFGPEWTETSVPFVVNKDVDPAEIRLVLEFDSYAQRFEIGPITLINCGPGVALADLPRTRVRYDGGAPDASWRNAAAERIEQIRKGDLAIRVVDAQGRPVPDAAVQVRMKRSAFNWGTAANSKRILDTKSPDSEKYRENLLKYFNQVVFENEMKWPRWNEVGAAERGVETKRAIEWLRAHRFGTRGHVLVWPSWENSPGFLRPLASDPKKLGASILEHIVEQTAVMQGQFDQWDVVNEPFAHDDFLKLLGRQSMVAWFKAARAGAPGVQLFLNDYTMFHGEGPDSASEKFFDNVKFLKDRGAPIDAIGEQGHIGGAPPGINKVLQRLDRFAELGLPIQISEFDINSNDDEFKARYLTDFVTAIYSHPAVVGFVQWGFWEPEHWFPIAALWNKDWTLRPHGQAYIDLVTKTWWTNADGRTDAAGGYAVRGFYGDYDVSVTYENQVQTLRVHHVAGAPGSTVTLP